MQRKKLEEVRCPYNRCDNRKLFSPKVVVRDHLLKTTTTLHKTSDGAPSNVVVPEEQQHNTVQNLYAQMVYDATASNFPDTHHYFLPQFDDVIIDVPHFPYILKKIQTLNEYISLKC